jgi:hypothetical protein
MMVEKPSHNPVENSFNPLEVNVVATGIGFIVF